MYSIKYRKLTLTQIRRSFISINCENKKWKKLKSDHALEWGQIKDTSQNWGFEIGDKNNPTEIELANNNTSLTKRIEIGDMKGKLFGFIILLK